MARKPIAFTIGQEKHFILAKIATAAFDAGIVRPHMFVRIPVKSGDLMCVVLDIVDRATISDSHIIKAVTAMEETGDYPPDTITKQLYKVAKLDPVAVINGDQLDEYGYGVGAFKPVYRAGKSHIEKLYPNRREGVEIGHVSTGGVTTDVPFVLTYKDMGFPTLITGRTAAGKTNFEKYVAAVNANRPDDERVPMIVMSPHPDIGVDNPNADTIGLLSLDHPNISSYGFDRELTLHPSEIGREEINMVADWSSSQLGLIYESMELEPDTFIPTLAKYDSIEDPLLLLKGTGSMKGPAKRPPWKQDTLRVVRTHMKRLNEMIDVTTSPMLEDIVRDLTMKKIVLINTYNLEPHQQAMFVKILIDRLYRSGMKAIGRSRKNRAVIFMDESQTYMKLLGDNMTTFIKQCLKTGIAPFLITQSPSDSSLSPEVKGQIHNFITFSLAPRHIGDLSKIQPDVASFEDVIQRRPIGSNKGVAVAIVNSQDQGVVIKVKHFEEHVDELKYAEQTEDASEEMEDATPEVPLSVEEEDNIQDALSALGI
jgi:hypothetical protein